MWSKLISLADIFIPPAIAKKPEFHSLTRRYQGVVRMLLTVIFVMLLYAIPLHAFGEVDSRIAPLILAIAALVFISLMLMYLFQSLTLSLFIANVGSVSLVIFGMSITGGISSPFLFVALTLPVITITFGDGRLFAGLCTLIAIGIVGIYIAQLINLVNSTQSNYFSAYEQFIVLIGTFSLTSFGGVLAKKEIQRGRDATREAKNAAEREARIDMLTGLANRRAFVESANKIISREQRRKDNMDAGNSGHFFLVMFDIDFFKRVNDTYGHGVGDIVLIEVSKALKETSRNSDLISRLGGEEFAALLECDGIESSISAGERFRADIENLLIQSGKEDISITISTGISQVTASDNFDSLLNKADTALYKAKESGRNCVIFHEEKSSSQASVISSSPSR